MVNTSTIGDGLYHDVVVHAARAYVNRMDEVSPKEDKEKEYRAICDSILADMLKDLEGYVPKKERQEMSNKEFEKMMMADQLREEMKNEGQ